MKHLVLGMIIFQTLSLIYLMFARYRTEKKINTILEHKVHIHL